MSTPTNSATRRRVVELCVGRDTRVGRQLLVAMGPCRSPRANDDDEPDDNDGGWWIPAKPEHANGIAISSAEVVAVRRERFVVMVLLVVAFEGIIIVGYFQGIGSS